MTKIEYQPYNRVDFTNNQEIIDAYQEFLNEHEPDDPAEYQEEKLRVINQGHPTWVRRNLNDTLGAIYDYYVNGKHIGFVEVDETGNVAAYMNNPSKEQGPEKILDGEPEAKARDLVLSIALIEQVADVELQTEVNN